MIGRSLDHLFSFCKDYRLKYIDNLSDIGHPYTVAVFVKDVQVNTSHQSVSHSVLLIKESWIGSRLYGEPGSPLVNDQADFFFGIILVHDGSMTADQLFHIEGFAQGLIPYLIIKVCGTSLNLPAFRMGIIMKRKTIHKSMLERLAVAEASRHNSFCPLIVIYVWTAGDLVNFLICFIVSHISLISPVLISVKFRRHVSTASPVLIAYPKESHIPGVFMTVFFSPVCHGGYSVKGHIFYPF